MGFNFSSFASKLKNISSGVRERYRSADIAAGGYLPGGVSPDFQKAQEKIKTAESNLREFMESGVRGLRESTQRRFTDF